MEGYIQHYGVKGMKWGVRRTPEELGHKPKKARAPKKKRVYRTRDRSWSSSSEKQRSLTDVSDRKISSNSSVYRAANRDVTQPKNGAYRKIAYVSVNDLDREAYLTELDKLFEYEYRPMHDLNVAGAKRVFEAYFETIGDSRSELLRKDSKIRSEKDLGDWMVKHPFDETSESYKEYNKMRDRLSEKYDIQVSMIAGKYSGVGMKGIQEARARQEFETLAYALDTAEGDIPTMREVRNLLSSRGYHAYQDVRDFLDPEYVTRARDPLVVIDPNKNLRLVDRKTEDEAYTSIVTKYTDKQWADLNKEQISRKDRHDWDKYRYD